MRSVSEIRSQWLAQLFSTAPADRPRAELGVRRLYAAATFPEPEHFVWFDSPFAATWAVALLVERYDRTWGQRLMSSGLSRAEKERLERVRATLGEQLGLPSWDRVLAAAGGPRGSSGYPPDPTRTLAPQFIEARFDLVDDVSALFDIPDDDDELRRAEDRFWGGNLGALRSALHCPTTDQLIGQSFYNEYSFSTMADDEHRIGDREPPAIMSAAWEVARSSGLWWPFENIAIMSERPSELHLNEQKLLHRGDGPAVVYRDGWAAYAWNGKAVPERWIMEPEAVPPKELKGFDPTFRKYLESRVGKPASTTSKRAKPSTTLKAALPPDAAARVEQLRAHAGGRLPLFDRYQAGEHQPVWNELIALGGDVRMDPHAADALAVAYETMRRVEANVRTIIERLTAMNYTFTADPPSQARAHVPPGANIRKEIADFEKEFGTLPLSLRAFYEVVGEVNLIGRHPSLDPTDGEVTTDPLVVYGLDEGLAEYDDDEERASAVTIAPDDLHKANVSGGDPYEMAIPDPRADGELLNERHHLFFVDYLRLCFRFGGFPGYEGVDRIPPELATLSGGLVEF